MAIIAFLHTLTDQDFVTAGRFSDPFARNGDIVAVHIASATQNALAGVRADAAVPA